MLYQMEMEKKTRSKSNDKILATLLADSYQIPEEYLNKESPAKQLAEAVQRQHRLFENEHNRMLLKEQWQKMDETQTQLKGLAAIEKNLNDTWRYVHHTNDDKITSEQIECIKKLWSEVE